MHTKLAPLLVAVKLADAKCRRTKGLLSSQKGEFGELVEAITELYAYLRGKSIADIERMCK